jgi:hypothetical protein
MSLIIQIWRSLLLLSDKCRGMSQDDTTHNVLFAIMLYYSQLQKLLVKSEIYSLSVLVNLRDILSFSDPPHPPRPGYFQVEDKLNRAD